MDNSIAALQSVQVKFLPPLHEQRRAWVLDVLRRESVTSVGPQTPSASMSRPDFLSYTGTGRRLWRGYPPAASHSHCAMARLFAFDSRAGRI